MLHEFSAHLGLRGRQRGRKLGEELPCAALRPDQGVPPLAASAWSPPALPSPSSGPSHPAPSPSLGLADASAERCPYRPNTETASDSPVQKGCLWLRLWSEIQLQIKAELRNSKISTGTQSHQDILHQSWTDGLDISPSLHFNYPNYRSSIV